MAEGRFQRLNRRRCRSFAEVCFAPFPDLLPTHGRNGAESRAVLPRFVLDNMGVDSNRCLIDALDTLTRQLCYERGYTIENWSVERDGYRVLSLRVPAREGTVRFAYNGEVFALSFPGGYSWADFAYRDEDREEALLDQIRFLDAYAAPDTREVSIPRPLRRDRYELRLSNGAVLRRRGWSRGPMTP